MTTGRTLSTVLLLGLLVAGGCRSSQDKAVAQYNRQLKERATGRQVSQKLYEQGMDLYFAGDARGAVTGLRKAVRADKTNARAWLGLGAAHDAQGNAFEAAVAFDRAAKLLPHRYEPRFNLGWVFEKAGKYHRAIREYEAALSLAPHQLDTTENLVRCLIKTRQQPDRVRVLLQAALQVERRPEWRVWLHQQLAMLDRQTIAPTDDLIQRPQPDAPEPTP
jgi:Tfp pilus assembly protein PilF